MSNIHCLDNESVTIITSLVMFCDQDCGRVTVIYCLDNKSVTVTISLIIFGDQSYGGVMFVVGYQLHEILNLNNYSKPRPTPNCLNLGWIHPISTLETTYSKNASKSSTYSHFENSAYNFSFLNLKSTILKLWNQLENT